MAPLFKKSFFPQDFIKKELTLLLTIVAASILGHFFAMLSLRHLSFFEILSRSLFWQMDQLPIELILIVPYFFMSSLWLTIKQKNLFKYILMASFLIEWSVHFWTYRAIGHL